MVGTFDEVDAVLATADVFLRPTSEPDSGVALCEAFAAGLPVVASDIAGHREYIEKEQNGLRRRPFPPPGRRPSAACWRIRSSPRGWARPAGGKPPSIPWPPWSGCT